MSGLESRRSFVRRLTGVVGGTALVGSPGGALLAAISPSMETRRAWAMGTWTSVSAPGEANFGRSLGAMVRIGERLSAHADASVLGALNRSGISDDRDLAAVVETALELGELTEGALDVTVLPAMRRLGFIPGDSPGAVLERIGQHRLRLSGGTVTLDQGGVDLGGIAKGYAVDLAGRALAHGPALVEAGGDILALGRPELGHLWRVGIQDPWNPRKLAATIELEDEAIATSGTYRQKRLVAGRAVSHLIDPRTARSVHHVVSATIVAPRAMTADGLATATSIMKPRAARALIEALPGIEGFWIYPDGATAMTKGLRGRLVLH